MKKAKSRSKLVRELDQIYSQYIRLKNADKDGNCICIICKKPFPWKKIQNGHFCRRSHYNTRWVDMNCHPQCYVCNCILNTNAEYAVFMLETYGENAVKELVKESAKIVKIQNYEIEEQIVKYRKIVVELLKQHGLE